MTHHEWDSVVTLEVERGVTVDDVYDIAVGGARVFASEDVLDRVRRSRASVERALLSGRKVYGLNTQVGHLRDREIHPDDLIDYQHQLLAIHARGIGEPTGESDGRERAGPRDLPRRPDAGTGRAQAGRHTAVPAPT